jgi:hypothetical protein
MSRSVEIMIPEDLVSTKARAEKTGNSETVVTTIPTTHETDF